MTESMTHVGPKWGTLGVALGRCRSLEDFRHQGDPKGSKDARCDNGMAAYSMYLYEEGMSGPWQRTLKVRDSDCVKIRHMAAIVARGRDESLTGM
jgi:hypothetical protein